MQGLIHGREGLEWGDRPLPPCPWDGCAPAAGEARGSTQAAELLPGMALGWAESAKYHL